MSAKAGAGDGGRLKPELVDDPTLPAGWFAAKNEDGEVYYFNEDNGEVSWDRPGPSGKLETCFTLGAWEAVRATHGEVYYWNKSTSEVSWDPPAGWDESATAPSTESDLKAHNPKRLVECMRRNFANARLQVQCMQLLKGLTHKSSGAKLDVAKAGGIVATVAAMRSFPRNAGVQEAGCVVIRSLARRADVVKILVDNGATDVCHAAKRQFPDNPVIAKCTELTLGEVVGTGDKPCVIS